MNGKKKVGILQLETKVYVRDLKLFSDRAFIVAHSGLAVGIYDHKTIEFFREHIFARHGVVFICDVILYPFSTQYTPAACYCSR